MRRCVFGALLLVRGSRCWNHLLDFPGAPALNASSEDFEVYRVQLLSSVHDSLDEDDWELIPSEDDSMAVSTRTDSVSGCPWIRADALLSSPLSNAAPVIVTNRTTLKRNGTPLSS